VLLRRRRDVTEPPPLLMSRADIRKEIGLSPANADRVLRKCRIVKIPGSRSVYAERRDVFREVGIDDPRSSEAAA
jgi:hypothetical protein